MSDFPTLPPPPDDLGEYLMHISGSLQKLSWDPTSTHLYVTFRVEEKDIQTAMEIRRTKGRKLDLTIHTPRGTKPFVAPGGAGVGELAARVARKKKARAPQES